MGVKVIFYSYKVVMTKSGTFVGKGYYNKGGFILNVLEIMNGNASTSSTYLKIGRASCRERVFRAV